MIVAESTRSRRLVGRLDRGADLLQQLREICRTYRVHAGEVRAAGALEDIVLGGRRLEGPYDVVSFHATVGDQADAPALQLSVTLGRARDESRELVGGHLTAARVVSLEFVIEAFDDVTLVRTADAASGQLGWVEVDKPKEKPAPTFDAPARTSWSDVMAASERRGDVGRVEGNRVVPPAPEPADEGPSHPEVHVQAGDYIDHPKFGRCQVERVDSDQEFVSARLRNQRLIRLSLDVLTLIPAGQEDGHNLFRAVAGKQ
ncbi:MAG: hypothetical protein JWN44_4261 [Myxococcales bacterium]|nr:hypothetical protein [Myxococcales bacterium]